MKPKPITGKEYHMYQKRLQQWDDQCAHEAEVCWFDELDVHGADEEREDDEDGLD